MLLTLLLLPITVPGLLVRAGMERAFNSHWEEVKRTHPLLRPDFNDVFLEED